jgi:hypothetical protein
MYSTWDSFYFKNIISPQRVAVLPNAPEIAPLVLLSRLLGCPLVTPFSFHSVFYFFILK